MYGWQHRQQEFLEQQGRNGRKAESKYPEIARLQGLPDQQ